MKNRIFTAFLCLICAFLLCIAVCGAQRATLFINDGQWEEDSLLPFIETDQKMLLPASAFSAIGKIKVSRSDTLGSLLFERDGAFLSYNLNFGTCLDESGTLTNVNIYRYGGEIYLEPGPICEKFGITLESEFAPDGYLAARILDGEATRTFTELLTAYSESGTEDIPFLYNPTGKTMSGVFAHPILLVPTVQNMMHAINSLVGHRITFAISPGAIASYAKLIPTVYAKGHTIVYYMDASQNADTEAFRESMLKANEFLFSLVGATARVYVSTDRYDRIPKIDGFFAKACNTHLVVDDLRNNQMINFALYERPLRGFYNFSLASDRQTRSYYSYFFKQFDRFEAIRSMPLTASSSIN